MKRATLGLAVAALVTFCLGPFLWMVRASVLAEGGTAGARTLTLANYAEALGGDFARALLNSAIVAGLTTAVCLAIGAGGAFALAKLRFPGQNLLLGAALAVSVFPPIATVSPLFLLIRALGLRDHLAGLILPYAGFALPLTLWILSAFLRELPAELYQAAKVDGCTPFQAFVRVLLPVAAPGIATTGILVFISAWNELLFALTFLSSPERRTVPVAITLFATGHREPWGPIAAASVVATLPLILAVVLFQRRIIAGLTTGAVKS